MCLTNDCMGRSNNALAFYALDILRSYQVTTHYWGQQGIQSSLSELAELIALQSSELWQVHARMPMHKMNKSLRCEFQSVSTQLLNPQILSTSQKSQHTVNMTVY